MIVITTPTGLIGHQVVDTLLGGSEPVRVVARDPARLTERVREGAEVVAGSHGDARVVDEAFAGADSVFWLAPPNYRAPSLENVYVDFTRPACEAVTRHGVQRVVTVSALGRGVPGDAGLASASLDMCDLISGTGVAHRALTLPGFMDNMARQAGPIRDQGAFYSPLSGDRRTPTCATRDIAAVAARLLADRSWSGQEEVPVLGPEDLSLRDMAAIMTEVLGRPVRHQQISFEAFGAALRDQGMSEAMVRGMVAMMKAKEAGLDNAEPRTPQATTPTSFRQWCQDVLKPAVLA